MTVGTYLFSLPERLVRSAVGLAAGVVREIGEVVVPERVRRGQLYQNLVDATLHCLIEQVGGVEGVYPSEHKLVEDFVLRRTAGHGIEILGILAFRASPVWVLAALADLCGTGRALIPEIADALKEEGLLERDLAFTSVEHILDGLERTSSRLAAAANAPPLDVPGLRQEWQSIREEAASIAQGGLPSRETVVELWQHLKGEAARQKRSVFELSSMLAIATVGRLPDRIRWLSISAALATRRTGHLFATGLLDYYRKTLDDIQRVGFTQYAVRQLRPYVHAAFSQFSPERRTVTQRFIEFVEEWRAAKPR